MPHRKFCLPLKPSCIPSKMDNSSAPRLEHMVHAPHITILTSSSWGINLTCAVNPNQHLKASKPQYPMQNELPPREQWALTINTLKNTYLMDFPPCNNPKYAIKLSEL